MKRDSRDITEICALRFQLLGQGDVMLSATQYACRTYLGILSRMDNGRDEKLRDVMERVISISEQLNRAALYRSERTLTDAIEKAMTDLRMIIDMHLHTLGTTEMA